jgi:hypothetical protein
MARGSARHIDRIFKVAKPAAFTIQLPPSSVTPREQRVGQAAGSGADQSDAFGMVAALEEPSSTCRP